MATPTTEREQLLRTVEAWPIENQVPIAEATVGGVAARLYRRPTADLAAERNSFAAALADAVLVAHAAPGGKTERLCRDTLGWGTPLFTLDSPDNAHLLALGARAVSPATLREWWPG